MAVRPRKCLWPEGGGGAAGSRGAVVWVFEGLPAGLVPPVSLALAKAVESVPAAGALPGGCLHEMKWDGPGSLPGGHRRGVLDVPAKQRLEPVLPESRGGGRGADPAGCAVDGEAVIWSAGRLDFDVLQQRRVMSMAALPGQRGSLPPWQLRGHGLHQPTKHGHLMIRSGTDISIAA